MHSIHHLNFCKAAGIVPVKKMLAEMKWSVNILKNQKKGQDFVITSFVERENVVVEER